MGTVMMGVTMVGDLPFDVFACNRLLAKHLAGSLTIAALLVVDSCLVSSLEVIAAGIFECMVDTTDI